MDMDFKHVSDTISDWMAEKVGQAGCKGVVLGLSGGVDSAVVAALAKRRLGPNVLGLLMPCESMPEDLEDARAAAHALDVETRTVVLDKPYRDLLQAAADKGNDLGRANLKARLRMVTLYFFANARQYLVAGTGNRTELALGYFTKYGDGGADLLPIGSLLKWQVRGLAAELGIPRRIIEKPPSAGLWPGQTDEGEIGICYDTLDAIVEAIEEGRKPTAAPQEVARVESLMRASQHKKSLPPICLSWR